MSETHYLSCAETAKLIRAELKAQYPSVKFGVRSHTYAGGASIDVSWTDGPTDASVSTITERYRGADFDGMIDLKSSLPDTLLAGPDGTVESVHFGADFIFTHRALSSTFVDALAAQATPNGCDSHGGRCEGCGDWPTTDLRWVLLYVEHASYGDTERTAFACSAQCAAKIAARHTDARVSA